jgi:tRNA dimethylallyltransferase
MAEGFLGEVSALWARGDLRAGLPSLRAVGYRQLWAYLAGECGLDAAVSAAQRATRNLAKRQLTWVNADDSVKWIRSLEDQELAPILGAMEAARSGRDAARLC